VSEKSIRFIPCLLPGCYLVHFPNFRDHRGLFVKSFQRSAFESIGLECDFVESFYTESGESILRGMHFQVPPFDHAKLIYCMSGAIHDVALDLRVGSPTYGHHETYDLSAEYNNAVYLPRGIAHGFFVRDSPAIVVYEVTSEHSPTHDTGVRWNSFGAQWPHESPITSERDDKLTPFAQFESPFRFMAGRSIEQEEK
jgi:dTDP-4-dehydrorhamnose 3,5-epimerase